MYYVVVFNDRLVTYKVQISLLFEVKNEVLNCKHEKPTVVSLVSVPHKVHFRSHYYWIQN